MYSVRLQPHAAGLEQTVRMSTALGSEARQTIRFLSFAAQAPRYTCAVTGSDFSVPASVSAGAAPAHGDGVPVELEVRYEPCSVGDARSELTVSAGNAVYRFLLVGHCDPPKPQGPLVLAAGESAAATYRNVTDAPQEVRYAVDNPAFVLERAQETVPKKGTASIGVSFRPAADQKGQQTGKLVVTCAAFKGISWVYYLQGGK